MGAAKTALAILGDVLLNMPHTQQSRVLRKLISQCRDQGKFSINCEAFLQSIGVHKFVQYSYSSPRRIFVLVLYENDGRKECGVQCGGDDGEQ